MGSCPDTDIDLYEETRSITTPPWMGCWSIARFPLSISPDLSDSQLVPIYTPG